MNKYLRNLVTGMLITTSFLFTNPKNAKSLDSIIEPSAPKIEHSIKKEDNFKLVNIGGGGNFNDAGNTGNLATKMEYGKFRFGVSHDYIKVNGKSGKEKSLFIANLDYYPSKNASIGISMNSDMKIGFQTTLAQASFEKEFYGLSLKGFAALKQGHMNSRQELENIFGIKAFKKLKINEKIDLNLNGEFHAPRKYMKDVHSDLWSGNASALVSYKLTDKINFDVRYFMDKRIIPIINTPYNTRTFNFGFSYRGK